jgi:hypothetical protein
MTCPPRAARPHPARAHRRAPARIALLVPIGLLAHLGLLAHAAPPGRADRGAAPAGDRAAAEQLFRLGADAFKAGRFEAAAENFERAYETFRAPEIAFSAAQAHRLQYQADQRPARVARAIALFEIYVRDAPTGGKRRDALAHLERLRDTQRALEAAGTRVAAEVRDAPSIYVSVALEHALITIDGKSVDRYTAVEVAPGEHTVLVSAEGHFPAERKVVVTRGQAMVPIELAPRPAQVAVRSEAGARALVDGRSVALGATPLELAPGDRLVTVYARGRQPVARELTLAPGQELTLEVPLQPTLRRRAVPWVLAGASVLASGALTAGAVALAADLSAAELRDARDPLSAADAARYDRLRGRRGSARALALGLGAAALGAAGAAGYLYYADTPAPDELARPTVRARGGGGFAPVMLERGLGLSVSGGF